MTKDSTAKHNSNFSCVIYFYLFQIGENLILRFLINCASNINSLYINISSIFTHVNYMVMGDIDFYRPANLSDGDFYHRNILARW
jgi:hypothetical protein